MPCTDVMAYSRFRFQFKKLQFLRPKITVAFAVVIALVVTTPLRSTDAAPQSGDDVISIDGQQCKCVLFYFCDSKKAVTVPSGSTESGCFDGLVCCRIENETPLAVITSTTHNPLIDNPQQQQQHCTCVQRNQCFSDSDDIREENCINNEICCNPEHISYQIPQGSKNPNSNTNVRSCGIGMLPQEYTNMNGFSKRIVNTEEDSKTYFGQFSWMVAIIKLKYTNQMADLSIDNGFLCGGSLIHPQVVLTAAHCVRQDTYSYGIEYSKRQKPSHNVINRLISRLLETDVSLNLLMVRVGEWDTKPNNKEAEEDSHQNIGISQIVIHPNHNNGSQFNDVALIKLRSAITPRQHINTICLPNNENQIHFDPRSCVSTGWGKNEPGKNSRFQSILKKIDLSIVPNDVCQKQLRNTRLGNFFRLHDSFICAGGIKGVDACKGDGGGPLVCVVQGQNSDPKKYVQVGIVSWGIGCGEENIPGVYSSVIANSQWINDQLKLLSQ